MGVMDTPQTRARFEWHTGLLTAITVVLPEHGRSFKKGLFWQKADTEALKKHFAQNDLPLLAERMSFLQGKHEQGHTQFGSSSLDPSELMGEEVAVPFGISRRSVSLMIGAPFKRISMMQWLVFLARGIDRIPKKMRPVLDASVEAICTMADYVPEDNL